MNFRRAVDPHLRLFLFSILILPLQIIAQDTLPSAMVERYISPFQTHYSCMPIVYSTSLVYSRFTVYYYVENLHVWKKVSGNVDSLLNSPMKGYSIWSANTNPDSTTIYYKGSLNTGTKSVVLTRTWNLAANPPAYDGWNLAGNPYPSASDFESTAWVLNNTDPTIYFFDGVNYKPYNRIDHIGNGTRIIPSGQGFFVHVSFGSIGILVTDNSTRVHSLQPYYKSDASINELLALEADGNGFTDETFIHLDSGATSHFDWQRDAYKLFGIGQAPQIYSTVADTFASINLLPYVGQNTIVPVGFRAGASGNYSIIAHGLSSFTYVNSIFLKDIKQNVWQNLMVDSVYSFTSNPSDDPDRFAIYFDYTPAAVPADPENPGIMIYSSKDIVYIKQPGNPVAGGDVSIYDLMGRQIFSARLQTIPLNKFRVNVLTGYYVVKVISDESTSIRKIFLR